MTRAKRFSGRRVMSIALLLAAIAMLLPSIALAQLDTKHWFPTVWSGDSAQLKYHYLALSTPELSPVPVTVHDGNGNLIISTTVSNSSPVIHTLGTNYNGPNVSYGLGAFNSVGKKGLVVNAELPVYATIRHKNSAQGCVSTGKGRKALGTEFRVGMPLGACCA